jgi:hypothetical protein
MRRNLTIILSVFGLMLIFVVAFAINLQESKSGSLQFPPIPQNPSIQPMYNLPTSTRLPWCAPLPKLPLYNGPRTPTPDIYQAQGTPLPYLSPSVTPIPYANIIDMDPQIPDRDKSYIVVYRCNGTFDLYKTSDSNFNNIPLNEGDVFYLTDVPLSLMEVHPYPTITAVNSLPTIVFTPLPSPVWMTSAPGPYP